MSLSFPSRILLRRPASLRLHVPSLPLRRPASSSTTSIPKPKGTQASRTLPPPRTTAPPKAPTPRSGQTVTVAQSHKQHLAQRLYAEGVRDVYRAPSHVPVLAASYIIGGSAITTAVMFAWTAYDDIKTRRAEELSWVVGLATRLCGFTFTIMACLALLRPLNMIRSVRLVQQPETGRVLLNVQVRNHVPFLRPRDYLVEPFDFVMERKRVPGFDEFDDHSAAEGERRTNIFSSVGRGISQAFYVPFAAVRKLMTMDGMVWVEMDQGKKKAKLDSTGMFSHGDDLIKMGTIKM